MTGATTDAELLLSQAGRIHELAGRIGSAADQLTRTVAATPGADSKLATEARTDAFSAGESIRSLQMQLAHNADLLAALAQAGRSLDTPAVEEFLRTEGEDELIRKYFPAPADPHLDGFKPFYLAQTRMVRWDWAQVYAQGPRQLTQIDTYHAGRVVPDVIGLWTHPRSNKKYHAVRTGGETFVFIPEGKLGPPIDASKIPFRDGLYEDGRRGPVSDLWKTPAGNPKGEWRRPGDPWQNFIIGNMRVAGPRGAVFPATPHANLCGELSVFFAVGETDLESGLTKFAQLRGLGYWNLNGKKTEYTGAQVLQNVNHGSSPYDLRRLFEAYGFAGEIRSGVIPLPDELAEKLRAGRKFVLLAELDTRTKAHSKTTGAWVDNPTYGQLIPGASAPAAGRTAHWVTVTDVIRDRRGGIVVMVMNTYSGCGESYSWEMFCRSARNPGSSAGSYTYLEASKPGA